MSVDIVSENLLTGTYTLDDMRPGTNQGDISVAGFARSISKNVGETIQFSINGPATVIRIFRAGYYGGKNFREVATITNTPTTQPELITLPNTNGATSAKGWSVTASWAIPANATSGMYMAMIRNAANNDAFYATFVVRDDAANADIVYKTSDTTWGSAYNHYGLISNINGRDVYGSGIGVGNILDRCYAGSYHRPVITRGGVMQTFWWACEFPLIAFLERNGYSVKYISSVDLDQQGSSLLKNKAKIFISSGHDEYWSQNMWDAIVDWRDNHGGHSIFMSGNEVFWRVRFEYVDDEAIMWCRKDTMPGPSGSGHSAGTPFVPGYSDWQGTWMDTRWPDHTDGALLTGTKFGMNGVYDFDAVIPWNGKPQWGYSSLNDLPLTSLTISGVVGFEADHLAPSQPSGSYQILAEYTRSAPGGLADANGEKYDIAGDVVWGILSQRYQSGGVTIGFGTCQWSWSLELQHDRGSSVPVNREAQQFTLNVLRDLGAVAYSRMSNLTAGSVNTLDAYGVLPFSEPVFEPAWYTKAGTRLYPYALIDGVLQPLFGDGGSDPVSGNIYIDEYVNLY